MIVVATEDFEVYHEVVTELRDRNVTFTTVEPDAEFPAETAVVVTGPDERIEGHEFVQADPEDPRSAVESALAIVRSGGGRRVVGVDPGERPGIAVLVGDTVTAAFHVPLSDAVGVIREEVAGAADPLVRVGDGARIQGSKIVNALEHVTVELVDETGTTPSLGTGARGMGDVLAAVNIANVEGEVIEERRIDPTEGELRVIQTRSREASAENRTIDEVLARRVARGELTVEEALAEHAGEGFGAEGADGDEDAGDTDA